MRIVAAGMRVWVFRGCLAGLLCLALPVFAHRPSESTAQFRWEHDRLEVQAVISLQMAATLLADPTVPMVRTENFPAVRERLAAIITQGFIVEASGQQQQGATINAELTSEGEIACTWIFPEAKRGPLAIKACFFDRLPADAFCWVKVWDGADRLLAQKLLVRDTPRAVFEATSQTPAKPAP